MVGMTGKELEKATVIEIQIKNEVIAFCTCLILSIVFMNNHVFFA